MTTALLEGSPPVTSDNAPLTRAQVATALDVSLRTVDRYVADGHLTPTRNPITGRREFDADQVERVRQVRDRAR